MHLCNREERLQRTRILKKSNASGLVIEAVIAGTFDFFLKGLSTGIKNCHYEIMKRVLLFGAKREKCASTQPHIGLAMLSAVLKEKGCDVKVLDYQYFRHLENRSKNTRCREP
jgi:hypothetical protein